MSRRLAAVAVVVLAGLAVAAGCGATSPATPGASPAAGAPGASPAEAAPSAALGSGAASTAAAPSDAPPSAASDPSGAGSSVPSSAPASPSAAGPVENPDLLAVLPATVAGQPVVREPAAFTDAVADAAFAANIAEAAFGVVVAGNDLASAVVARPADGVYSDAWFRDWRESYDEGACAQAGGVTASAETTLGGRTVYAGSCAGGLRTYHAWLADRGLLVSAFAVGENDWGSQLMAGLRP